MNKRLKKVADNGELIAQIEEYLETLSDEELCEEARNCNAYDGSCEFADVFNNDEVEFNAILEVKTPYEMFVLGVESANNGEFDWDDEFCRFVDSETLESVSMSDLADECKENISEIAKTMSEDIEFFDLKSKIDDYDFEDE